MSVLNRKKQKTKKNSTQCTFTCSRLFTKMYFTRYRGRLRRDKIRVFTGIRTMPFELLIHLDYAVWSSNFNSAVFLFII